MDRDIGEGELDNLTRAARRHTISMKSEADMTAATKSMEGERSGSNRGYGVWGV